MRTLLDDIELDVQELKYLMEVVVREPNSPLREVAKRNILQMQGRLDTLLSELNNRKMAEKEKEAETKEIPEPSVSVSEAPIKVPEASLTIQETPDKAHETLLVVSESSVNVPEPLVKTVESTVIAYTASEPVPVKEEVKIQPIPVLGERIRTVTNLRQLISLNDSFRFSRELFGSDSEKMNDILQQISGTHSLDEALAIVSSQLVVDEENEAMSDFIEILKKYFN